MAAADDAEGPVRFVAVDESLADPASARAAAGDDPEGVLRPNGLGNEARAGFERRGVALAARVRLLDRSALPSFDAWAAAVGAGFAGLTCLGLAWVLRPSAFARLRRLPPGAP